MIKKQGLLINHGVIIFNELYFANGDLNGLYRINLDTMEYRFVSFFPDEPILKNSLYLYADCDEERIVFSPFLAERIAIFNLNTKEFKTYIVPQEYWWSQEECRFMAVKIYGRYAYFYGLKASILKLDMENGDMTFWTAADLGIDQSKFTTNNFGMQIRQHGDYIYNVICGVNRVFRFSLLNERMESFALEFPKEQVKCVSSIDDKICLLTNKSIWLWDAKNCIKYINYTQELDFIWKADYINGSVLISLDSDFELLVYSEKEELLHKIVLKDGQSAKMSYMPDRAFYIGTYVERLLCFTAYNNSLCMYDKNYKLLERIQLVDEDCIKFEQINNENILKDKIIMEGTPSLVTLKYIMDQVCTNEEKGVINESMQCNIGEKIYESLMNE